MRKILVTYRIPYEGLKSLEDKYEIIYPDNIYFSKTEIIEKIVDCDVLLSFFSLPVDKDIIDAGKNLKLISNYGVGYNNIDIDAANRRGISVCNTPQSVCRPTAEITMGLILSLSRKIAESNYMLRVDSKYVWGQVSNLGFGLNGKTLGIIGMGRIGVEVSKLAQVFGLKIFYYKRNRLSIEAEKSLNVNYCSFNELLSSSDIISIHTPLDDNTYHLIDNREFDLMKSSALLINTSRGSVVCEDSLIMALENKRIYGAALDVFENEPNINPILRKFNNLVIVPHIGTATVDARIDMSKEAGENILNFFNDSPTNIVN